jgi:hypothetical protein
MCDPGPYAGLLDALPLPIPDLVQAVQGLMAHIYWVTRYQINPPEERKKAEVSLRAVQQKLARLLELDPAPLNLPRPPERRLIGNCRDFTLLTISILKGRGIPARARCGFGAYFFPNHYEDHWVVEYLDARQGRWIMVDTQLDALQRGVLHVDFNTLDMPPGQFITGGQAWLMCRRHGSDPDQFGIFEWHGWDFIRGDLLRDVLALNNVEVLPWDDWAALATPVAQLSEAELARLDTLAKLTANPAGPYDFTQTNFESLRSMYEAWPEAHFPRTN